MVRWPVILIFLVTACRADHDEDLSGRWSLCLESGSRQVCGVADVAGNRGQALRYSAWYPLTFDLDLDSLPDLVRPPKDRCGSVLVDDELGILVDLALPCDDVVTAHDGGNVAADFLKLRGDSLVGEWYQSCFNNGCPARGGLTMVRVRGLC